MGKMRKPLGVIPKVFICAVSIVLNVEIRYEIS